ncbi:MAG: aldehyde ferredoxin oxidoreductase family protein [Promethearchaeota archaeon]
MSSKSQTEYFGFIGKILRINLNNYAIYEEKLNQKYANDFLGGAGYACRYLYDFLDKATDPLLPENILMIMTGPLCLTSAPSFGRFVICAKSPYTNAWGESNCGGFFGPELKKAGYDGIIITGKSENPVYLKIFNNNIEILDANEIWGMGIKGTQRRLKTLNDDHKAKVLSIGHGGENLVKYATVNADGRSAGRTGMGAILGSKNLKAIIVRGTHSKPKSANPDAFKNTVKKTLKYILDSQATKVLKEYGTSAGVMSAHGLGDLPIKYWSLGEWEKVIDVSGEELRDHHLLKKKACYACPISCGRIVKIKNQKYEFPECEGPEYETIAGFGSMILNNDLDSIAIANNLCNDYGIDTISTSSAIALLYDLFNKKIISSEDVDGLSLNWGNSEAILELIKKTAHREGIGNLIAEGSNAIGQKFGVSPDEIATVKNLEVPYHDIRSFYGLALTYAFAPRGACHTSGDVFKVMRKGNEIDYRSIGIKKLNFDSNSRKMALYSAKVHDYRALYSSLISCFFSNPPPEYMAELLSNLLGGDYTVDKLIQMGERIFTMKRLFNLKMGLTPQDDEIPSILLRPTNEGAVKGKSPDFNTLKKFYYNIRNWDPISGMPREKKLKELDLINLIAT